MNPQIFLLQNSYLTLLQQARKMNKIFKNSFTRHSKLIHFLQNPSNLTIQNKIRYAFCQSHMDGIQEAFTRGLYDINPISKTLNRKILGLAYSPGVGYTCKDIQAKPELIDTLTLRGRSVAVVTQGNMFAEDPIEAGRMMPIVDWVIAQIKFFSEIDAFPFILRKEANIKNCLEDISNSYACILLLDDIKIDAKDMPKDSAVIYHSDIVKKFGGSRIDCQNTARVVSYALKQKKKGVLDSESIVQGVKHEPSVFKKNDSYFVKMRDGREARDQAYSLHQRFNGKIRIELTFNNIAPLQKCFTEKSLIKFAKNNTIFKKGYNRVSAIVTDGTAILGYGDIGPRAGLPVMEGKSLLFRSLGGANVVPICINKRKTPKEAIEAILDLTSYFKAINLEDIAAPECFEIERTLSEKNIVPVFHDDQHGTAIITLAALINAAKLRNTPIEDMKVVVNGAGAAGITIANLLLDYGVKDVIVCDSKGAIYEGRKEGMNRQKTEVSKVTNKGKVSGNLEKVIKGTDVFVGVSVAGALKKEWVKTMNKDCIIFAMANPDPEILPNEAYESGALIYGSGRSDFQNQINNSLVFPGIFRGIHLHDLPRITNQMKLTTAQLIADSMIGYMTVKNIIPDSLDRDVPVQVAEGLEKFKH